ncbi:MAG: hypothetical protein M0C28_30950 [Candidatus Moduliflexus flocculans]|nr:hypothetical protein [Candidatus Moduliflexus flocculans]
MHVTCAVESSAASRHHAAGSDGPWRWAGALAAGPAALGAAPAPSREAELPSFVSPRATRLVWSDEFDRDGLPDPSRWGYDTGRNKQGWHNRELQYYGGPRRGQRAGARRQAGDHGAQGAALARQPTGAARRYTSARLLTPGKARMDLRLLRGSRQAALRQGAPGRRSGCSAARVTGQPAANSTSLELVGREPTKVFSTVHTASGSGGDGAGAATEVLRRLHARSTPTRCTGRRSRPASASTAGRTSSTRNAGTGKDQWPFDAPQFLILNIAHRRRLRRRRR